MSSGAWAYTEQLRRYSEKLLKDHWDKKQGPSRSEEQPKPRFKRAVQPRNNTLRRK